MCVTLSWKMKARSSTTSFVHVSIILNYHYFYPLVCEKEEYISKYSRRFDWVSLILCLDWILHTNIIDIQQPPKQTINKKHQSNTKENQRNAYHWADFHHTIYRCLFNLFSKMKINYDNTMWKLVNASEICWPVVLTNLS